MLLIENLSYSYQGRTLLNGLSFQAAQGETLALVGPKSAGKSLLLRLIAGWIKPSGGSVLLNQREVWRERRQLKRFIAYVPGRCPFEPDTKAEDILELGWHFYPYQAQNLSREEFIELWQLAPLLNRRLRRLETYELDRLLFSFVHLQNPQVLLLDDPSAASDPWHRTQLIRSLLNQLAQPLTLIVTHDLNLIQHSAQRLLILKQGKLLVDVKVQSTIKNKLFNFVEQHLMKEDHDASSTMDPS